jgi:hypothetical protein
MCFRTYFQRACGHISPTANETRNCDHHEQIEDWRRLQLPESQGQIDYCHAMCNAESYSITRTEDGVCPGCAYDARVAAETQAMRQHNEILSRIRASVAKPPPQKKRRARNGESSKRKK